LFKIVTSIFIIWKHLFIFISFYLCKREREKQQRSSIVVVDE